MGGAHRKPGAECASEKNGFGDFLRFETLTLCPIDTRCIEHSLLSRQEVDWLNHYHAEVRRLLPLVMALPETGCCRPPSPSEQDKAQ
jgi:hypothetical protein